MTWRSAGQALNERSTKRSHFVDSRLERSCLTIEAGRVALDINLDLNHPRCYLNQLQFTVLYVGSNCNVFKYTSSIECDQGKASAAFSLYPQINKIAIFQFIFIAIFDYLKAIW